MKTAAILIGAAAMGFLAGGATSLASRAHGADPLARQALAATPAAPPAATVSQCYAVDGDTLRCEGERIRLLGIDSPEMPGHCTPGRRCVQGDPFAAKAALSGAVSEAMPIRRFGTDHDGRTLALVQGPLGDLSCSQLRTGHAIYRPDRDNDGALLKACRAVGLVGV